MGRVPTNIDKSERRVGPFLKLRVTIGFTLDSRHTAIIDATDHSMSVDGYSTHYERGIASMAAPPFLQRRAHWEFTVDGVFGWYIWGSDLVIGETRIPTGIKDDSPGLKDLLNIIKMLGG